MSKIISFPKKKYKVIYADPPWTFKNYSKKGEARNVKKHYDCLTLQDIKELPIKTITDDDCVLLMWVTGPMLEKAFDVIKDWGFTYKTLGFCWAKTNRKSEGFFMGNGYWSRSNAELCLLATKGKPKRLKADVRQLLISQRREHSRKPDEMYERIERLLDGPYIELFARAHHKGWDHWGNQTEKFKIDDTHNEIFD